MIGRGHSATYLRLLAVQLLAAGVTDNAFVTGNLIPVYADATGMVIQVLHEETDDVKAGDLLIRLDEQRARAALGVAEGELGRVVREVGGLFKLGCKCATKLLLARLCSTRRATTSSVTDRRSRAVRHPNKFCKMPRTRWRLSKPT